MAEPAVLQAAMPGELYMLMFSWQAGPDGSGARAKMNCVSTMTMTTFFTRGNLRECGLTSQEMAAGRVYRGTPALYLLLQGRCALWAAGPAGEGLVRRAATAPAGSAGSRLSPSLAKRPAPGTAATGKDASEQKKAHEFSLPPKDSSSSS